ncbi:MFS transporter superfamily protein [Abortiporus biennis]
MSKEIARSSTHSSTSQSNSPVTPRMGSQLDVKNPAISSTSEAVVGIQTEPPKGFGFWMIVLSLCVAVFCSALEVTAVPTALPTITEGVHGQDFVWVNSAFSLAATSLIPTTGGLADIFGRRGIILSSFLLFALGSALCGAAKDMTWLIAGRSVQGAGSGGILSLSSIILSDLVSLRERAKYNGIIGLVWALTASVGPLIGGGFAKSGNWRWLFYVNIPLTGFAGVLVLVFLKLKTPKQTLREKLARIDWIGNFLIVASSASAVIGLTWGGVKFPWNSAKVLVPLILGLVGLVIFTIYEFTVPREPIMPYTLLSNRTSVSGYLQTFLAPIVILGCVIFQPAFFQACFDATPIRSGVLILPSAVVVGGFVILGSVSVAATKRYRPQLWLGWIILTVSSGVSSTLRFDSSTSKAIAYPVLIGWGGGLLYACTYFPVLAPLPVSENAHALALFAFFRSFAGVWVTAIGSAVIDNLLGKKLSPETLALFPGGANGVYFSIPLIGSMPEPARTEVRRAFAESIGVLWEVLIGVSGLGLLSCFLMKGLPLHTQVDENWGLEQGQKSVDPGMVERIPLEEAIAENAVSGEEFIAQGGVGGGSGRDADANINDEDVERGMSGYNNREKSFGPTYASSPSGGF